MPEEGKLNTRGIHQGTIGYCLVIAWDFPVPLHIQVFTQFSLCFFLFSIIGVLSTTSTRNPAQFPPWSTLKSKHAADSLWILWRPSEPSTQPGKQIPSNLLTLIMNSSYKVFIHEDSFLFLRVRGYCRGTKLIHEESFLFGRVSGCC